MLSALPFTILEFLTGTGLAGSFVELGSTRMAHGPSFSSFFVTGPELVNLSLVSVIKEVRKHWASFCSRHHIFFFAAPGFCIPVRSSLVLAR